MYWTKYYSHVFLFMTSGGVTHVHFVQAAGVSHITLKNDNNEKAMH